jgi:hypothetical protein
MNYRKLWENKFGKIPLDENGVSYEIHHLDGDRNNNSFENLICVPIKEHYEIHLKQKDWGACKAISIRMKDGISSEEKSKLTRKIHTGRKRSEETKKNMSNALKGRTYSNEHRKKLSEGQKGKPKSFRTDTHKLNLSKALIGKPKKPMSEETKQKIRDFQKNKVFSAETKQKISEALKGRKLSEETREKISEALTGRKLSEETRQKMRKGKYKNYESISK